EPFGQIPTDPAQAERWRENMGRIVAYREAFEVPASEAVLSEEPRGSHAVQAWQDARAAGLDLRTQQDRLAREQASAAALERMGIDPTARTAATSTATLPETAVVVDVDRLLEQKPAWVAQYGMQPADGDARDTWREQVATVAAYRDAHGVPDEAYRLPDPGMVDRDSRHAFAEAEQAHEDLRRTGWMRDRDGAERNTAGPVPVAETTVEAAPPATDRTAAADAPERAAGVPKAVSPGDGPADPPVATPAVEPVEKPAALALAPASAADEVARLAAELRARQTAAQQADQTAEQRAATAAVQERTEQVRRQQEAAERQRQQQDQRRGPRL
ncbi:hypothetical protein NY542_00455, partial [Curtobacterium flaccumfaciens pv. betae]|nr:hypothetical protein [Curtobacterium flaccumfaciens pv. betae]